MENYEINEDTLAVLGIDEFNTLIIEKDKEYQIPKKAYEVMEENCQYYGSSYSGRNQAAKTMLDCSYKLPILIEESSMLIFFPTKSSLLESCCWINYNGIKSIEKNDNNTNVLLTNNKEIELEISSLSFQNQVYRSTKLESIIRKRLKGLKKD